MHGFTHIAHREQLELDSPPFIGGENPSEADIIGNARENRQFLKRLTSSELRHHVCQDYELGLVDAPRTMQRLADGGLYGTREEFLEIFCAGLRALAAVQLTPTPLPPAAPGGVLPPPRELLEAVVGHRRVA